MSASAKRAPVVATESAPAIALVADSVAADDKWTRTDNRSVAINDADWTPVVSRALDMGLAALMQRRREELGRRDARGNTILYADDLTPELKMLERVLADADRTFRINPYDGSRSTMYSYTNSLTIAQVDALFAALDASADALDWWATLPAAPPSAVDLFFSSPPASADTASPAHATVIRAFVQDLRTHVRGG
jgi:hypothetical protein